MWFHHWFFKMARDHISQSYWMVVKLNHCFVLAVESYVKYNYFCDDDVVVITYPCWDWWLRSEALKILRSLLKRNCLHEWSHVSHSSFGNASPHWSVTYDAPLLEMACHLAATVGTTILTPLSLSTHFWLTWRSGTHRFYPWDLPVRIICSNLAKWVVTNLTTQ